MTVADADLAVTGDMERVFAPFAGVARPRRSVPAPTAAAPWRHWHRLSLAIVALILVAALGWTGILLRRPTPDQVDRGGPAPPRTAGPAPPAALPTARAPRVPPVVVAGSSSARPVTVARTASPQVAGPVPVPDALASPTPTPAPVTGEERPASVARTERGAPVCQAVRDRADCLTREVAAAVERLQRAYDKASASAVTTSELVLVRRDWNAAAGRAAEAPRVTIRTLDDLTTSLYNRIEAVSLNVSDAGKR